MNKDELNTLLDLHCKWWNNEPKGQQANLQRAYLQRADLQRANLQRADLRGANLQIADLREANLQRAYLRGANLWGADLQRANLQRADLRGANLREANLREANLQRADLRGADLWGADLCEADLREANLQRAYLRGADLWGADLRGANLWGADLQRANLRGADLRQADLPHFQIPQEGELIVWKKISSGLCKLRIPPTARRTASLVGRKCRAEFVEVLECVEGSSLAQYVPSVVYSVGSIVYPDKYDDDIRVECASGIHFFLTRREAEEWE